MFLIAHRLRTATSCQIPEHAKLREQRIQDALVEPHWTKPPALVLEDWNQR